MARPVQAVNPGPPTDTPSAAARLAPGSGGHGGDFESASLEVRIERTGAELLSCLSVALDAVPAPTRRPQALAAKLGIDKVLASRVLKAVRAADPISAVHRMPGPDPLRRVLGALEASGAPAHTIEPARRAVERFDALIRRDLGDRSSLDAVLSAWVPEARREFELRRKQAAFRALSQLKGAEARSILATVMLHPSDDGTHLDVVWINGLVGVQRLRPGASVKITTRRMSRDRGDRAPRTLDGAPVADLPSLMLREFCSDPLPRLRVQHAGESVHYALDSEGFGPASASDIVFAEANMREIKRFRSADSNRKGYVFAETSVPAAVLQFDALLHDDAFPGATPQLRLIDTAFEGVADVNDPAREIDTLDMLESVEPMGRGLARARSADVPRYTDMLARVCGAMNWDPRAFRGHRVRIDYPVYGSQVAMLFDLPPV